MLEPMLAGQDCRIFRAHNTPSISFSPMNHTPNFRHESNEWLHESIFLRGIDIMQQIIIDLANKPDDSGSNVAKSVEL